MSYRDELDAARLRVEALQRELRYLVPDDSIGGVEVEVVELRRRMAAMELTLQEEQHRRERAETEAGALMMARDRLRTVEKALELVQQELQRRRREHEPLWREAALGEIRRREIAALQERFDDTSSNAEKERRRADAAEVALIRTQMRLSVERARAQVRRPWPMDAPADEIGRTYLPAALAAMPQDALRLDLERLTLLVADLVWNVPTDTGEEVAELFGVLRRAGHPLVAHAPSRFGPDPIGTPGLRIVIAPLGLQIRLLAADGSARLVTIADDESLLYSIRL